MRLADATNSTTSTDTHRLHNRCSAYVWMFYPSLVGVEAMACYCYLASLLEQGATEVRWEQMAEDLGLKERHRLVDALCSLEEAGMVELSNGTCHVRRRLPTIDAVLEVNLPSRLRRVHSEARRLLPTPWPARTSSSRPPSILEAMRDRARAAAVSLLRTGNSCEDAEAELSAHGFHPSLVSSSAVWALWHLVATARDRISIVSPLGRTSSRIERTSAALRTTSSRRCLDTSCDTTEAPAEPLHAGASIE